MSLCSNLSATTDELDNCCPCNSSAPHCCCPSSSGFAVRGRDGKLRTQGSWRGKLSHMGYPTAIGKPFTTSPPPPPPLSYCVFVYSKRVSYCKIAGCITPCICCPRSDAYMPQLDQHLQHVDRDVMSCLLLTAHRTLSTAC